MEVGLSGKERTMTMLDEETCVLDRFRAPLYTVREAARYLDVPERTFATWALGYRHQSTRRRMVVGLPVLTTLPKSGQRRPVIPFLGLAEGLVLTAMRRSGVPLQRIRPALAALDEQFGLSHALASSSACATASEYLTRSSSRTCVESYSVTTVTPG